MLQQRVSPRRSDAPWKLGEFLTGLTWEPVGTRQHVLRPGTTAQLVSSRPTLIYLSQGSALPTEPGSWRPVRIDPSEKPLHCGDFLFSAGRRPLGLTAVSDLKAVVVELQPVGTAATVALLPDALTVRGFSHSDPAVALLAASMGCPAADLDDRSEQVICAHIATTVMSVALRAWAERGCAPEGWLSRAADPQLALAVDAMHTQPERSWSVAELARLATMSRSVFAERFREQLGTSPLHYLSQTRIELAKSYLDDGERTVAEVSRLLGYGSEDGFRKAFRRVTGTAPSTWRATREPEAS